MKEKAPTNIKYRPVHFGPYVLLDRLNVGGMAEVFRAKSVGIGDVEKLVAIKRILPHLARDPEFTTMFMDEARIAVNLHHANIAQVYELGEVDEALYISMEYVEGRDIRALVNRLRKLQTKLEPPIIAYIISKVCEGLDYAHRKRDVNQQELQIVHRDVSPQNVIISFDGEVKIIDFGIAKAASKRTHTEAGILKGKFGYMAPEQVMGESVNRRADIFCVGILMYELLTTERLFAGTTELSTLQKIRSVEITPPSLYNGQIPEELEEIVLRALTRRPEDRYQFASEMQAALHPFLIKPNGDLFTSHHMRQFMEELFVEELEADRKKLEQLLKITPGRPKGPIPIDPSEWNSEGLPKEGSDSNRFNSAHFSEQKPSYDRTPSHPKEVAYEVVNVAPSSKDQEQTQFDQQGVFDPQYTPESRSAFSSSPHAIPSAQSFEVSLAAQIPAPFSIDNSKPPMNTSLSAMPTAQDLANDTQTELPTLTKTSENEEPALRAYRNRRRQKRRKRRTMIQVLMWTILTVLLFVVLYFLLIVPAPDEGLNGSRLLVPTTQQRLALEQRVKRSNPILNQHKTL